MTDDLGEQITAGLNQQWPNAFGMLERQPSRSARGTPLFVLHWTDGPTMQEVRQYLDSGWPPRCR